MLSSPADLRQRFLALDRILLTHRHYWQFQAFHHLRPPWSGHSPELARELLSPSAGELPTAAAQPEAYRETVTHWLPGAADLFTLCTLDRPPASTPAPESRLSYAVPGRKWSQIQAFAPLVPAGGPILEWCAGKGHLGRVLASRMGREVISLERDPRLCAAGQALARRAGAPVRFARVDALQAEAQPYLLAETAVAALHACGDLHLNLIDRIAHSPIRSLTLSPCCYHLTRQPRYQPRSPQARRSALRLERSDLQMVVRQTVTAPSRTARAGATEITWRLGFDSLQRAVGAGDAYRPLDSVPRSVLGGDFAGFCAWAAARQNLPLPASWDAAHFLAEGHRRYRLLRRTEWLQHVFQRPLELWLLLDYALYLEAAGYRVTLQEFCDYALTPRNLAITAVRRGGAGHCLH